MIVVTMSIIRGRAAGAVVAGFLATHAHTGMSVDDMILARADDNAHYPAHSVILEDFLGQGQHETLLSIDGYMELAASEAMSTTPYYDGAGVLTVCFGETKGVQLREYAPEECAAMLVKRIETHFGPRTRSCTPPVVWDSLSQTTRDALISFSYNIGVGGYCGSSARKRLTAGQGIRACERILPWNKIRVNGALQPDKGLTNRRNREAGKCRDGFQQDQVTSTPIA